MQIPKRIVITVNLTNPTATKAELKRTMRILRRWVRELAKLEERGTAK